MKKYIVAALFVIGALAIPNKAHALSPNTFNLYNAGASSTTLVATGPGTLFGIYITSGTAADYAVCYDSASISGLTTTSASTSIIELERVFVSTANGLPGSAAEPLSIPTQAFTNGLVCVQSAADRTLIYYRQPN